MAKRRKKRQRKNPPAQDTLERVTDMAVLLATVIEPQYAQLVDSFEGDGLKMDMETKQRLIQLAGISIDTHEGSLLPPTTAQEPVDSYLEYTWEESDGLYFFAKGSEKVCYVGNVAAYFADLELRNFYRFEETNYKKYINLLQYLPIELLDTLATPRLTDRTIKSLKRTLKKGLAHFIALNYSTVDRYQAPPPTFKVDLTALSEFLSYIFFKGTKEQRAGLKPLLEADHALVVPSFPKALPSLKGEQMIISIQHRTPNLEYALIEV